ncbi:MAG: hypothetical protein HYX89_04595, partial [Chloroflexi bacterium]|nr:hypothetical protein [Chloroflexota bacterium]
MSSTPSVGRQRKRERGQALVVFAVSATAILASLSLVLDAGNWFLTRRSLQNVADAAVLVGAQQWNRDMQNPQILCAQATRDARIYATKNGVATDPGANQGMWNPDSTNGVLVNCPPATGPYAGNAEYIEVQVAKQVNSLLAGLLGFGKIQVSARAVARCRQLSLDLATFSADPGDPSTSLNGSKSPMIDGNTYSVGTTHTSGSGDLRVSKNAYAYGGFVETGSSHVLAGGSKVGDPYSDPPPLLQMPLFTAPTASPSPGTAWSKGIPDADGYYHVT